MSQIFFEIKFQSFQNYWKFDTLAVLISIIIPDSILTGINIRDIYFFQLDNAALSDTMTRQAYVFAQFLNLLPRYDFQNIVNKYKGDYRVRQFKCWNQLSCMIFAHIRQENSLRDIDIALNAHANKLYHIGIRQSPKSTLADANERRNYRIYEEFAKLLMHHARREYAQTQLAIDVDNAVYALDASVIDLTLSLFPWAKFRKTKGAIKLHAMLDLRGNIPVFLTITDGKVHDVKAAPQVPIEPEGI